MAPADFISSEQGGSVTAFFVEIPFRGLYEIVDSWQPHLWQQG
ncbi:Uncharacterised protein [Escherichia coli]|nr:Uncharacterised protein [Escherichia coli]